jgi:HPt (histidine-containing phosphotransfer) domain-containing protein
MQDDVALYRQCGCDDVLAKPIDRARFFGVLQAYVPDAKPLAADSEGDADDDYASALAELTEEFARGLPTTFGHIGTAARDADWPRLKSLLHTLKGTAGSYGFAELTTRAGEIEARLAAGDTDVARALSVGLSAQLKTGAGARVG